MNKGILQTPKTITTKESRTDNQLAHFMERTIYLKGGEEDAHGVIVFFFFRKWQFRRKESRKITNYVSVTGRGSRGIRNSDFFKVPVSFRKSLCTFL